MARPLPEQPAPPSTARLLTETLVALAAFVSCWALMTGAKHWAWWTAALGCGAALFVFLVLKLRGVRTLVTPVELPPARPLPTGAPHGRKLSKPPGPEDSNASA
ncbi:MAG: hypothetical protein AMXMBFR7_12700 [Planctomycetota bacterium]